MFLTEIDSSKMSTLVIYLFTNMSLEGYRCKSLMKAGLDHEQSISCTTVIMDWSLQATSFPVTGQYNTPGASASVREIWNPF